MPRLKRPEGKIPSWPSYKNLSRIWSNYRQLIDFPSFYSTSSDNFMDDSDSSGHIGKRDRPDSVSCQF